MASNGVQPNTKEDQAAEKERMKKFANDLRQTVALKHILKKRDRKRVQEWIEKFYEMDRTAEEQILRNDYLWFLRVQLDTGYLNMPFLKNPPKGQLVPINKAVDVNLYADILSEGDRSIAAYSSVNGAASMTHVGHKLNKPNGFVEQQPQPNCGLIVYGCCFSNER